MEFGEVQPHRGIRKRDPISPHLYILCAEGLNSFFIYHEKVGLIHGCKIARGAHAISHLLFVNNNYFFFKATGPEATYMRNILGRYEQSSIPAINFTKSSVVFSPNTSTENRNLVCDVLQMVETHALGQYLGLPMCFEERKKMILKFCWSELVKSCRGEGIN